MISPETALEEVPERLIVLERQNRRLKQMGLVALIVAASLVVMAQAAPEKKPARPKVDSGAAEPRPHSADRGRRIHTRLFKVGQYRAVRSGPGYQDSSEAVWDTLRLTCCVTGTRPAGRTPAARGGQKRPV
jgi:hypothetical protein